MDQFYFEEGYIETGYLAVIREASAALTANVTQTAEVQIADTTGYFIEDYIETGYFVAGAILEAAATLTVSATVAAEPLRIKTLEANFEALFSPSIQINATRAGEFDLYSFFDYSATVSRTRDHTVTLENLVNLSLQAARTRSFDAVQTASFDSIIAADRTRDIQSSQAVSFTQTVESTRIKQFSADIGALFTPGITPVASVNGSIDLLVSASLQATSGNVQQLDSTLASITALTATVGRLEEATATFNGVFNTNINAIEYQLRPIPPASQSWRPLQWANVLPDTNVKKYGVSSARITNDSEVETLTGLILTSGNNFSIGAGQDFVIEYWHRFTENFDNRLITSPYQNQQYTFFQLGSPTFEPNLSAFVGTTTSGNRIMLGGNGTNTSNRPQAVIVTPDNNTNITITLNTDLATNTFYHWILRRTNNVIYFTVNNTTGTANYSGAFNFGSSTSSHRNLFIADKGAVVNSGVNEFAYFDAMAMRVGDSTVTGSINAPINSYENQIFLFQFDNTTTSAEDFDSLEGPWPVNHIGNAALQSQFAQTASAGATQTAGAALNSAFTQTVEASQIIDFAADLNSEFAVTAQTGFLRDANSEQNATFSQIAEYGVIRRAVFGVLTGFTQNANINAVFDADTALNSETQIATQILRIKPLAADFSAFYTQLTATSKIGDFFVNCDAVATQTADVNRTASGASDYLVNSTQNTVAERARDVSSAMVSTASITVTAQRTRDADSDLNSAAAQTVSVERIRNSEAALNTSFDIETDAAGGFIGLVATELAANSTVTVTATRIKQLDSAINSTASLTASGDRAVGFEAALSSTVTLSLTPSRTRPFGADLDAFYSQLSAVSKIGDFFVNADVVATITANAVVFGEGEIPLDVVTSQTVSADRTRGFDADFSSAITANITAIKAVEAGATLLTAGTFGIDVIATKVGDIDLNSNFAQTVSITKTTGYSADFLSTATQVVSAGTIKQFELDIDALFSPSINAGINRVGSVDLAAQFTLTASGRIINTLAIVYTIPRESRTYTVERESRSYTIHRENRTYTIEGDT